MPLDFLSNPERVAYQSVPASLLESDLQQYFHLTPDDHRFLLSFRGMNRIGVALQIGLIRLMGYLPEGWREQVPAQTIRFVAAQVGQSAFPLPAYADRPATRTHHLAAVLGHLRVRKWEPLDAVWLEPWLLERALEHDNERLLLSITCQKLQQDKILRPAIGTLERLVGGISERAQQEAYQRLSALLTDELCQQLDRLLVTDPDLRLTPHRWLAQSATMNNPAEILSTLVKLNYLQSLGVADWDVSQLHPNHLKRLSLIARSRSNRHLERLPTYKRYALLIAFVRESLLRLTDDTLSMYDAYWEHSLAKTRREYEQYQQRVATAKDTALHTLGQAVGILLDEERTPADQVRTVVYDQIPRDALHSAWEAVESLLYPTRHSQLTFLGKRYPLFKQFTPTMLRQIPFQHGFQDDDFASALAVVTRLQMSKRVKWPAPVPTGFIKPSWRQWVIGETGQCERQAYELCVLSTLRDRLRSGDVFVTPSHRYADLNSYLLPTDQWTTQRAELCAQLNLPDQPIDRLTERIDDLQALLEPMHQLLAAGGDVRIEDDGLVVSRLTAVEVPEGASALQAEVSRRMPAVDLTDLLVEVNAWVSFTEHLPGLEHAHRSVQHEALLLASVLAVGCNIPLSDMARSSGLAYQSLWWTALNYLREDTLKGANNVLVNEHHRQWLVSYWGDGTFSSSDGQRFPVRGKVRNARSQPNYYGPGKGVTKISHSSDQYAQYGSKVIASTVRDATVVLDEIMGNETNLQIIEHTTDTAGYTDIIFALFDLLGLQFSPRLRDIADQKLCRIKGQDWTYPDLKFTGLVNPDYIARHFDELLRVGGSIRCGRVTASLFIQKLQAYPRQHNLTYVLQTYGQLIKTIFILRYLQSQPLRRRINAQLNKGEELHALRAWLWFGSDRKIRRKQEEDQSESARCLTLLTNIVVLWNTVYMQEALRQLQAEGYPVNEDHLEYLSPCRYEHINRLGKYSFAHSAPFNSTYRRPLRHPEHHIQL